MMMGKSMNWNKRSMSVVIPLKKALFRPSLNSISFEAKPSISFEVKPSISFEVKAFVRFERDPKSQDIERGGEATQTFLPGS